MFTEATMSRFSTCALGLLIAWGHAQGAQLTRSGSVPLGDLAASSDINNVAVSRDGTQACVVASYVKEPGAAVYSLQCTQRHMRNDD